ncbi:ATP-binding cassette domain-containing protein, partial [Xanthomonas citri pv. citri]|nr:ATP-binding cassette domain-containing protein [Xanthomonas citri pv. citri]
MRDAHLRALGLTKTYGMTRALDHIDIAIPAGQSVAVMGPSGSGKTTLLHCLSGILSPDSGSIELALPDRTVNVENLSNEGRAKLRRQSLGFVFQQGMLVPELTAVENTALPLMLNDVSRTDAVRYATQWLESMGLGGMEDRRIGQLSGGQAQRVTIARSQ